MEQKKILDLIKEKKWIALGAAVVVLILILILLLNCCGSGDGGDNSAGADVGGSTSTSTSSSVDGGDSGTVDVNPEDKTYDEDLVSTWYLDGGIAMVLNEEGVGSLYYGDEDGGEIQWFTVGNRLVLITEEKTSDVTYVIDGDDLTLTFKDGTVENWFR